MLDNHSLLKKVSKAFQGNCIPIFDVAENVNHLLSKFEKLKPSNGAFEQLVESYSDGCYKDGKMPGKRGWKDGDLLLLHSGDDKTADLAAHAESKRTVLNALQDIFGDKYTKILKHPVAQAFIVFDHRLWRVCKTPKELAEYGVSEIKFLLSHYSKYFHASEAADCLEQWERLKAKVMTARI